MHPILLVLLIVSVLLSLWAQAKVKSTFARFSRIPSRSGMSGAQVAQWVLQAGGVQGVRIEPVSGHLSDHYDPRRRVLRLSPSVFGSRSVAAVGVAAHEAGHAIQHARNYAPLSLRNLAVPTASLGSSLGFPLILLGLLFQLPGLAVLGLLFFAAVVLFQLITLPVEIDASRRAVQVLSSAGILQDTEERRGVKSVLTAAAMTYVAAALSGVVWLLHFGLLVLGGRRG